MRTASTVEADLRRTRPSELGPERCLRCLLLVMGTYPFAKKALTLHCGSGGHFSPEYFDYVRIPKFPDDKQVEIALLYHQDGPSSPDKPSLDTFVDWHRRWNASLGIWELDREMKALQHTLSEVQEQIIEGKNVIVPN